MMATSGMSYAVHYDLSGRQDGILQDFSRMRIEAAREPPVLYVAMASWIPKCNMYHHNCEPQSPTSTQNEQPKPAVLDVSMEEKAQTQTVNCNTDGAVDAACSHLEDKREKIGSETKNLEVITSAFFGSETQGEEKPVGLTEDIDANVETIVYNDSTTSSLEIIQKSAEQNVKQQESEPEMSSGSTANKIIETADSDGDSVGQDLDNTIEKTQEEKKTTDKADKNLETTAGTKLAKEKLMITPKKTMSPKHHQKKIDSEKKRQQKQLEREEREKKRQEEKERLRLEKLKQKQEKDEQKQKERVEKAKERELKEEQKRKEKEEKETKRKEREEREEQKRKEREQEKLKRQQELDERNKEKQKQEEQKQKAAAAFVNFFVTKKPELADEKKSDERRVSKFMPFEVKSDMRMAPSKRRILTEEAKHILVDYLDGPDDKASYLIDLKGGKQVGRCPKTPKTWPYEDDVLLIEEDFGESICEDKPKSKKMRSKFLKFHENRRPPYCGTWRKKSNVVNPRRPFVEDKNFFDYEVDSDDDWEEEEQGESLNGSDDEEKENEVENDDYEVDNEFFVPHGHLSDDEVDDESTSKLSPESHKQKLKLLKDEFDQDMQMKTNRMKPRSIGCIWYKKDGCNVDEAIDRHLRPLAMITNGQIIIKKRSDLIIQTPSRKYAKELREDLIPAFLKLIHGNVNRRTVVVDDFIAYMQNNGFTVEVSKAYLGKRLKQFAQWKKCLEEGPMLNKFCWCVEDEVKNRYNLESSIGK